MDDVVAPILSEDVIEEVFQNSIDVLRSTRERVFRIAELGRQEMERVRNLVEGVEEETRACIQLVDESERASREARSELAKINLNFSLYSHEEIRAAYMHAERCLVRLSQVREREAALRRRRDDLQRQLKHLEQLLGKADHVVSQVGIAVDFLSGNVAKMNHEFGNMRDQAAMARQIIRAQEEERRRVARDIHDGPAQLLANLVLRIQLISGMLDNGDERLQDEVEAMQGVVQESLHDLRRLIFNLRPMALDDLGLAPAIRGYIDVLREHFGIDAQLIVHGAERRMSPAAETALFRVMQEAVNNAHRHGNCRHVSVALEFTSDGVRLSVRDDGRGFDVDEVLSADSRNRFGLINMRERMRLLGGTFRVTSSPQHGTVVSVGIPWSTAALTSVGGEGGLMTDDDTSVDC